VFGEPDGRCSVLCAVAFDVLSDVRAMLKPQFVSGFGVCPPGRDERIPLRRSEILGVSLSGLLQFRTVFDEPVCVLSLV
jgi:hypothetical protein